MAPTILVAGATGNTGRKVVETLSTLLNASNNPFSGHRVVALTRSLHSSVAQRFATLPVVLVLEQNWVEITADWLREHEVVRAFIASHNQPNQFAEESAFHVAALNAGVQYVVRISTTAANVRPDCLAYYPRTHWAIEALLSSPEFGALQWTSLQPNVFSTYYLSTAADVIKQYSRTGKQDTLRLMASPDAPVGIIHPDDVGVLAARLLCQEDPAVHNHAKYVLTELEDITGKDIVKMVEQHIGTRLERVTYKDMSAIDYFAESTQESKNIILSIKHAQEIVWEGKCSASTTSREVLELVAPTRMPVDVLRTLLEDGEENT
ncbi:NAD(P)-binding protein [Thozetella sp. PMI_491]|nr:NAD(P)-binding protein [Thozetella sp. PMI_491]